MRVLAYGKRLAVVLAGVLLGASLGLSSVASGEDVGSRGFANPGVNRFAGPGFNPTGRGLNRAGPNFPAFNPPAPPRMGQLPSQPNLPVGPIARPPIINPVVVNPVVEGDTVNVCVAGAEQAFLFINDVCAVVNNAAD